MAKPMSEMGVTELKVAAYDLQALIEELTRRLQILKAEIMQRVKVESKDGPSTAGE